MKRKRKQKERRKQIQRLKKRRRSLHDKHKRRRKKDMMIGMPFVVAYQGDPAMGPYLYCDQVRTFKLISPPSEKPFARLYRYQMKPIKSIFLVIGKILVKEAPKKI